MGAAMSVFSKRTRLWCTGTLAAVAAVGVLSWYVWRHVKAEADVAACTRFLPQDLSMSSVFADSTAWDGKGNRTSIKTVRQKLRELRACCKDGVIYDGEGNRIVF